MAKLSAQQVSDIRKCLNDGYTGVSLAKKYGVSTATISLIKNAINWAQGASPILTNFKSAHRGVQRRTSKLNPSDVVIIRHRASSGERQASLAREFGVSKASICLMLARKTWKDIA